MHHCEPIQPLFVNCFWFTAFRPLPCNIFMHFVALHASLSISLHSCISTPLFISVRATLNASPSVHPRLCIVCMHLSDTAQYVRCGRCSSIIYELHIRIHTFTCPPLTMLPWHLFLLASLPHSPSHSLSHYFPYSLPHYLTHPPSHSLRHSLIQSNPHRQLTTTFFNPLAPTANLHDHQNFNTQIFKIFKLNIFMIEISPEPKPASLSLRPH